MTSPPADGHEAKAEFDPHARYVGPGGVVYKDFADYLRDQPDEDDHGNAAIARFRISGRSEAFCRVYRQGYDEAIAEGPAPAGPDDRGPATSCEGRTRRARFRADAIGRYAALDHQEREEAQAADERAHCRGLARAAEPFGPNF